MEPPEQPPAKPYHAKRPHKKSRSGCLNCKTRKVKCDEARPACRSCRRRQVDCVYPNLPPSAASTTTTPSSTAEAATTTTSPSSSSHLATYQTSPSPSPPSPSSDNHVENVLFSSVPGTNSALAPSTIVAGPVYHPPGLDSIDMKLLWFYTTATCTSFSIKQQEHAVKSIMRDTLVRYAFESPFLMDAVLALSSLHLQHLNQEFFPGRALTYRVKSLEGYRRAVEEARPEDFPALVANSLLVTALSSQVFRDPDGKDLYILDWIVVWRGIGLIIHLVSVSTLVRTGMNFLFFRPPIDLDKSASYIPNKLLFMVSSIPADDLDYPCMQTYYLTLKYLGALYMHLGQGFGPIMRLRIVTWFTFIPDDFIELAQMRRPRALVIIAYSAAFLKLVHSDVWWMAGIGRRTLQDITNYLGPEWHDLLGTPLMALQIEDPMALARVILDDPSWASPNGNRPPPQTEPAWVDDMGRVLHFDSNEEALFA